MPQHGMIVGDNWWAILVAAGATYIVGALIYGAGSKLWMSLTGYTMKQLKPHRWKMAISWIMPLLTAIGLALAFKGQRVDNPATGVYLAFEIWFFLLMPVRLYSFVYSPEKPGHLLMDAIHLLLGILAAGAIIASWP